LAALSEAERSIALLYLDERSYREIADVLGISESNVGVRLNRVKKRLMEYLQKENRQ
jgi:RNA polymerase sigma-70 factor (ECF subfamily)